ncbi:hypothetical protein JDV02_000675 [Purpureocillium takamizusanense]|uniref:Uncharacterized protein n=1 Tax=Purpureocillium takamizusanense TaxID=2060973 RepID=A0A9Q8Q793_9HYPO|nr:uncharacterized protein JDV02_000675 [Purpureocillium takamizusanense]UNI13991.1 hypothetical protein JDV02_000675 [Purpureocillium takamizusanense]
MFDLYGVSRPEGWLSMGRARPGSRTRTLQICHSCGDSLRPGAQCSRCGHDFCSKCAAEVPQAETPPRRTGCERRQTEHNRQQPSRFSLDDSQRTGEDGSGNGDKDRERYCPSSPDSNATPQHRTGSLLTGTGLDVPEPPERLIPATGADNTTPAERIGGAGSKATPRKHPFLKPNVFERGKAVSPQAAPCNARASKPRRLSDCVPRRLMDRSSTDSEDCGLPALDDPREESGAYGQHHPICCTARRGLNKVPTDDGDSVEEDGSLQYTLHRKIDQLYQHAEELQSSRNAIKHLASALENLDRDSGAVQKSTGVSIATTLERDAVSTGRLRVHTLGEDPKTPIASSVSCHDLDADDKGSEGRSLRLHGPELDDDFGSPGFPQLSQDKFYFDPRRRGNNSLGQENLIDWCLSSCASRKSGSEQGQELRHGLEYTRSVDERTRPESSLPGEPGAASEDAAGQAETGSGRDPSKRSDSDPARAGTPHPPSPHGGSTGQDIPSMTSGPRHRRGTTLCQPPQAKDPEPEPWPLLRRVELSETDSRPRTPDAVPWSRSALRKVPSSTENLRKTGLAPSPATWRQSLRMPESWNEAAPAARAALATPASQWRRNLASTRKTSFAPVGRANVCSFCNPSAASSPPESGRPTTKCDHIERAQTREAAAEDESLNEPVTPTRVRVRQVEQDLAMKRAEELEDEAREGEESACDPETLELGRDDGHSCAWRDRYMGLHTELEKWKKEMISYDPEQMQTGEEAPAAGDKDDAAHGRGERPADEVGIEGLTIVVHMRYRDDLVINTNLRDGRSVAGRVGPES